MKHFFYFMTFALVIITGCTESFKKGDKGLDYKIISDGKSDKIAYNEFMQVHVQQLYKDAKKDTILTDTRTEGMPQIFRLDSTGFPSEFYAIVSQIRKGDSVVLRIKSDSIIKKSPPGSLPFMKKGQYFYTTLRVLNIFKTPEAADSANRLAFETKMKQDSINAIAQLAKDDKVLQDYFAKNNIKTTKASLGTYVEVIQQGSGSLIDSSKSVNVFYTGKTLEGKVFDSNTDPKFNHTDPLMVAMKPNPMMGGVIKGWTDGLLLLSKGAKARFYIPSSLAYGSRGAGADIQPNAILIFDIEVADVLSAEQAKVTQEQTRKKMEALQKHFMDSLQKVQADTAAKKTK